MNELNKDNDNLFMPYAAFRALPLGMVLPDGWLKGMLLKEANGFTGHQTEFCFPFNRNYWAGQERAQNEESVNGGIWWYPWEQMGYWVSGAYRCAKLIGDDRLMQLATRPIHYTLQHPINGWFLGPQKLYTQYTPTEYNPPWDYPHSYEFFRPGRWPECVFFRALMSFSEGNNDPSVITAMQKHYLADSACAYKDGPFGDENFSRERTAIESILYCYGRIGDVRLLNKAKDIWSHVTQSTINNLTDDRSHAEHGVSYAEASKIAAILYLYTGDTTYRWISTRMMDNVFTYHMLVSGTPSTTEDLSDITEINGHETCDIYEFNRSMGYLLMATGKGTYADRIERALFNAGMGDVRKDWSGCQYLSFPNQALASKDSANIGAVGTGVMLYGPNADHRPILQFVTSCCHGNISNLLPEYAEHMWMDDGKGGLAAVLYGPCHVNTLVGPSATMVGITEETDYPFGETITFTISLPESVNFPLYLRIPEWCTDPLLTVNGLAIDITQLNNGFFTLQRTLNNGDKIALTLPMPLKKSTWPNDGVALERGPLVFSLKIEENWQSFFEDLPETTSPAFPMWAATPASPWNYALVMDPALPLDKQVQVETVTVGDDPWSHSPISLKIQARQVNGWAFDQDGTRIYTPPLPDHSTLKAKLGTQQEIVMVPYGSTCLRMTVLPFVTGY